jgi:AcrR family transcriptional regulator
VRRTARPASKEPVSAAIAPVSNQEHAGFDDIREAVTRLKRERILATAVELFHKNGLNNTTLEAVAERMNVTKPFIYSHFLERDRDRKGAHAHACVHARSDREPGPYRDLHP